MSRRIVVPVLFALVLIASGANLWLALNKPDASAKQATPPSLADDGTYTPANLAGPGGEALDAAVATLPLSLTYDYRKIKQSVAAATRGMTDDFAQEFRATFMKTALPLARDKSAVTDAVVRAGGLVRVEDGTRALCLVYVDQLLVSSKTMQNAQAPVNVSQNRVLVALVKTDGAWLVDGIAPI